ncbi:MAG: acetoacetate--CoA ligase [Gammaproteobacteria bacterium]|nr:acetoacetate--CoA ligase [Gammaproteobacteria bacterium]
MNDRESPLWRPSPERIAQANMTRFIEFIRHETALAISDYPALYQWSIEHPEMFWPAVWRFCDIKASQPWRNVLQQPATMPGALWFEGARLSFAENLLRRRDDKAAIIFWSEDYQRRSLSYAELYSAVAKLAAAMRAAGIKVGDRVAGYLPNLPETIIAMLATTSIGAIWSSCSPDFGVTGTVERFSQIEPKLLFCADGYYFKGGRHDSLARIAEIVQSLPTLKRVIVIPYLDAMPDSQAIRNGTHYQDFINGITETEIVFEQLPFDHPLYILYSSGTTGLPKCIVHGAGGTLIQHLKELILHTDLKTDDRIFYYTTCGWMMWNWLVSSLTTGATVLLYDGSPFHPHTEILFDYAQQENMSIFGTSAKYLSALEKSGALPGKHYNLNRLKAMLSTGSPLAPESFEFVYREIKSDLQLSSISGGTDIVSCFALGNPLLPVYRGELQCRGLGMKVAIYDENGKPIRGTAGELVCEAPTPSMPIYFWNDPDGKRYRSAYFERFPGIWAHGDYAALTKHDGLIVHGRSDTVLNPGGVRIGTAEIYRQVEKLPEVMESIAIGQEWRDDVRIILFVKLREDMKLTEELSNRIKATIRSNTTPRHVPAKIIQVTDVPRTISGKIVELAVRNIVHNRPVTNIEALANPKALDLYKNLSELQTD